MRRDELRLYINTFIVSSYFLLLASDFYLLFIIMYFNQVFLDHLLQIFHYVDVVH